MKNSISLFAPISLYGHVSHIHKLFISGSGLNSLIAVAMSGNFPFRGRLSVSLFVKDFSDCATTYCKFFAYADNIVLLVIQLYCFNDCHAFED